MCSASDDSSADLNPVVRSIAAELAMPGSDPTHSLDRAACGLLPQTSGACALTVVFFSSLTKAAEYNALGFGSMQWLDFVSVRFLGAARFIATGLLWEPAAASAPAISLANFRRIVEFQWFLIALSVLQTDNEKLIDVPEATQWCVWRSRINTEV
jgi:hypothetical protein